MEPSERDDNEHARMDPSGQEKAEGGEQMEEPTKHSNDPPQSMETQEQHNADQQSNPVHPSDLGAPMEEQPSAPPPKRGQGPN